MVNTIANIFVTALFVTAIYDIVSHGSQTANILSSGGTAFANIERGASGR